MIKPVHKESKPRRTHKQSGRIKAEVEQEYLRFAMYNKLNGFQT